MNQLKCLPQEEIVWGHNILEDVAASLGDRGIRRPITFTVGFLESLHRDVLLPGICDSVGSFIDLPPHVPDFAVRDGLQACLTRDAQSIVALGGGSVLDAAKAVSYAHFKQTGRYLPIAAFPTTLSGSEFSHYFGVTGRTVRRNSSAATPCAKRRPRSLPSTPGWSSIPRARCC